MNHAVTIRGTSLPVDKIVVVCGPTAAGKTRLGIDLAQRFEGEIVSADSQQVWRGFDIGTAKPSLKERAKVPHYLVDILNPDEHFDASRFVSLADEAIRDIVSRGKAPFVVGGTGMYIKMLVHGLCGAPPRDVDFRRSCEVVIEEYGVPALYEKLAEIDPKSAVNFSPNDRTRIIRALEIHHVTGVLASEFRCEHSFGETRYNALKIGLNPNRDELYERINNRVDEMIDGGLVDEVKNLLNKYDEGCQPFQAVGYREIVHCLRGRNSLDDAINLTKQNSRHLAKRQLTWFRSDREIHWFESGNYDERIVTLVKSFFSTPRNSL